MGARDAEAECEITGACVDSWWRVCIILSKISYITHTVNSYVAGNVVGTTGVDLISEAGGGLIAVTLDYRLGVFGMYSVKWRLILLSQLRW